MFLWRSVGNDFMIFCCFCLYVGSDTVYIWLYMFWCSVWYDFMMLSNIYLWRSVVDFSEMICCSICFLVRFSNRTCGSCKTLPFYLLKWGLSQAEQHLSWPTVYMFFVCLALVVVQGSTNSWLCAHVYIVLKRRWLKLQVKYYLNWNLKF